MLLISFYKVDLESSSRTNLSTPTPFGDTPSNPQKTKRLNSSSPTPYTTISPSTTSHNTQSTDQPTQNPISQAERIIYPPATHRMNPGNGKRDPPRNRKDTDAQTQAPHPVGSAAN
eukprot:scaffold4641_cov117-Isochrysis_galbana.AAC.18